MDGGLPQGIWLSIVVEKNLEGTTAYSSLARWIIRTCLARVLWDGKARGSLVPIILSVF